MEELYTEVFFKEGGEIRNAPEKIQEMIPENPSVEIYEMTHQMLFNLEQLEKILAKELENVSDYQFIFTRIKEKIKAKCFEEVTGLLNELEELMDLDV